MFADMDPADIPNRLKRVGRSQADLARHLALDSSSLTKTIKGQRRLKADELIAIEQFLEQSPAPQGEARVIDFHGQRRGVQPRRIPVYGYAAAGGEDRVAFNEGQIIEWIDPPPLWSGAGELIGVRVVGVSMEPRLFEGELVIAQLNLPPRRDRDCLVEFKDGSAVVKTYANQKDGHVHCKQWNPVKGVQFEGTKVKSLHEIVWRR